MQLPKASNDRLIFAPSCKRSPRFFVADARSDPARSMIESTAFVQVACAPDARSLCWMCTCKTAWERDDAWLASVGADDPRSGCYCIFKLGGIREPTFRPIGVPPNQLFHNFRGILKGVSR